MSILHQVEWDVLLLGSMIVSLLMLAGSAILYYKAKVKYEDKHIAHVMREKDRPECTFAGVCLNDDGECSYRDVECFRMELPPIKNKRFDPRTGEIEIIRDEN